MTPNGMSQTEQPKGPILARTTYYFEAEEVKMQRSDGFQDDADRVNEEMKAHRDVVGQGQVEKAYNGMQKRHPAVMDDPAAIERPSVEDHEGQSAEAHVARAGRDHAAGRLQRGLPMDPDPRSPESGLRASSIAAIAYDAVQRYKEQLGQDYAWWVNLKPEVQLEIQGGVAKMMRGEMVGAVAMHANWAKNMKARGVTEEGDPRVGQGWCDLDPIERRKGIIFAKVVAALLQPV